MIVDVQGAAAHGEAAASTGGAHGEGSHAPVDPMEYVLMLLSLLIAVGGIYLGRLFYLKRPELPTVWAEKLRPLYKLSFNKWYWDHLLDVKGIEAVKAANNGLWQVDARVVNGGVNGAGWLGRFWARMSALWDKWVIDLLVNATGWVARFGSIVLRSVQTGMWNWYAILFAGGLLLILAFYTYPAVTETFKVFFGR